MQEKTHMQDTWMFWEDFWRLNMIIRQAAVSILTESTAFFKELKETGFVLSSKVVLLMKALAREVNNSSVSKRQTLSIAAKSNKMMPYLLFENPKDSDFSAAKSYLYIALVNSKSQ